MTAAVPAPRAWDLVERAQAGDSEAMADIYRTNYDRVFAFVYFRTGNRQVAEDLTEDVFERMLRRLHTVQWQGRDIVAWLTTIARNLIADHIKSARHRLEVTVSDVLDGDRAEADAASETLAYFDNVALLTAVKDLNPEQHECIRLRFLCGLNLAETAAAMGKNVDSIKALQYRATQRLSRDERVRALVAA